MEYPYSLPARPARELTTVLGTVNRSSAAQGPLELKHPRNQVLTLCYDPFDDLQRHHRAVGDGVRNYVKLKGAETGQAMCLALGQGPL